MRVPAGFPARNGAAELTNRRAERDVLDRLLDAVRAGESRALVVHGEPGTGKTALLEYLGGRAVDCRAARTAGIQYHLGKVFTKLDITSRRQLRRILPATPDIARRADSQS